MQTTLFFISQIEQQTGFALAYNCQLLRNALTGINESITLQSRPVIPQAVVVVNSTVSSLVPDTNTASAGNAYVANPIDIKKADDFCKIYSDVDLKQNKDAEFVKNNLELSKERRKRTLSDVERERIIRENPEKVVSFLQKQAQALLSMFHTTCIRGGPISPAYGGKELIKLFVLSDQSASLQASLKSGIPVTAADLLHESLNDSVNHKDAGRNAIMLQHAPDLINNSFIQILSDEIMRVSNLENGDDATRDY